MPSALHFSNCTFSWVLIRSTRRGDLTFDLVVSKELLEGCVPSNLDWGSIHGWVFRCATIGNKVFESITNVFIIRFWNVANNIKT